MNLPEDKIGLKDRVRNMWQVTSATGFGGANVTGAAESAASVFGNFFGQNATLADMFNATFRFFIIVGAILAVLRLVYGGFIYITKDIASAKQSATTTIQQAVIGLLLLLAIYLILFQINPQILSLEFFAPARPALNVDIE